MDYSYLATFCKIDPSYLFKPIAIPAGVIFIFHWVIGSLGCAAVKYHRDIIKDIHDECARSNEQTLALIKHIVPDANHPES